MRLFVVMDDVLADTFGKHIELYNTEYKTNLKRTDIAQGEVWQNVPEAHRESIYKHALTPGFFRDLDPIKNSQEVMKELCNKHEVYIATAASQFPNSLKEKSDWLDAFFPFITWEYRIYCGHKFMLDGDLLIDDRAYNLKDFDGATFLFTSPHNHHETAFDRVNDWLEIGERLL